MSFETAKKYADFLLESSMGYDNEYINKDNAPGLVMEFIGGEPLLEIDLIDKITDYFIGRMIELDHPWRRKFMISICSNGVLYMDPRVQKYIADCGLMSRRKAEEEILAGRIKVNGERAEQGRKIVFVGFCRFGGGLFGFVSREGACRGEYAHTADDRERQHQRGKLQNVFFRERDK